MSARRLLLFVKAFLLENTVLFINIFLDERAATVQSFWDIKSD